MKKGGAVGTSEEPVTATAEEVKAIFAEQGKENGEQSP